MAAAVRILGLDPGLNHTGWGIIDTTGAKSIWVASGVFDIPKGETAARLAHIAREIEAVIKTHLPTVAACERVFVNVNPQSTLLLGHARGAAIWPVLRLKNLRQAKSNRPLRDRAAPTKK